MLRAMSCGATNAGGRLSRAHACRTRARRSGAEGAYPRGGRQAARPTPWRCVRGLQGMPAAGAPAPAFRKTSWKCGSVDGDRARPMFTAEAGCNARSKSISATERAEPAVRRSQVAGLRARVQSLRFHGADGRDQLPASTPAARPVPALFAAARLLRQASALAFAPVPGRSAFQAS